MDPSRLRRWLVSKMMSSFSSLERQNKLRAKFEKKRNRRGEPHVVEYFHQVDDPYSYLSAQVLRVFCDRYDVHLICHLVSPVTDANSAEPDLLRVHAIRDAHHIAPHYKLDFPCTTEQPSEVSIAIANSRLAKLIEEQNVEEFVEESQKSAEWFWRGKGDTEEVDSIDSQSVERALRQGNARRKQLRHYSGAMFYYAGEWYWGIDRLHYLELRLRELGLDSKPDEPFITTPPDMPTQNLNDQCSLTLEIFPSLRSPYTAISFDRVINYCEQVNLNYRVRPVLPMVMRGVPATREKGEYILFDTGREARRLGVDFGPCFDPIGEPTRKAYSLLKWAEENGKLNEFYSTFLKKAWCHEVNTNTDKGLREVIEASGLDWQQAQAHLGGDEWQAEIEENRLAMYGPGLWGVPSFRLLDQNGEELFSTWGQDRLWLVFEKVRQANNAE